MNQIILTNWNLEEAEKIVIKDCIQANRGKTYQQLAKILKIGERKLYRRCVKYGIEKESSLTVEAENRAIKLLKTKGYSITK